MEIGEMLKFHTEAQCGLLFAVSTSPPYLCTAPESGFVFDANIFVRTCPFATPLSTNQPQLNGLFHQTGSVFYAQFHQQAQPVVVYGSLTQK